MRASQFLTMLTVLCAVLRSTGAAVQEPRQHHEALSRAEQDMSEYVHTTETRPNQDISLSKVGRDGARPARDDVDVALTTASDVGTGESENKTGNDAETVTIVTTPLELIMAVNQSDSHIEIRAHLNLTGVQLPAGSTHMLGDVPAGVLSIQGNCSNAVPGNITGAALLPRPARQCLIFSDAPLMVVAHGSLWLDNLYVRRQHSRRGWWGAIIQEREGRWFPWQDTVKLWMSNVTMQADGDGKPDCHACAIDHFGGQMYAEGCHLSEFEGGQVAAFGPGRTAVSFVNSEFHNDTIAPNAFFDGNHAVIEARSHMLSDGFAAAKVMVRLEGINMTNISAQHPLVATGGTRIAHNVFFSDTQLPVFMPELRANISATANLSKAPAEDFLTSDDLFIVELKHKLRTLPRAEFVKRNPHSHSHGKRKAPAEFLPLFSLYAALVFAILWACCGCIPRCCTNNSRRRPHSMATQTEYPIQPHHYHAPAQPYSTHGASSLGKHQPPPFMEGSTHPHAASPSGASPQRTSSPNTPRGSFFGPRGARRASESSGHNPDHRNFEQHGSRSPRKTFQHVSGDSPRDTNSAPTVWNGGPSGSDQRATSRLPWGGSNASQAGTEEQYSSKPVPPSAPASPPSIPPFMNTSPSERPPTRASDPSEYYTRDGGAPRQHTNNAPIRDVRDNPFLRTASPGPVLTGTHPHHSAGKQAAGSDPRSPTSDERFGFSWRRRSTANSPPSQVEAAKRFAATLERQPNSSPDIPAMHIPGIEKVVSESRPIAPDLSGTPQKPQIQAQQGPNGPGDVAMSFFSRSLRAAPPSPTRAQSPRPGTVPNTSTAVSPRGREVGAAGAPRHSSPAPAPAPGGAPSPGWKDQHATDMHHGTGAGLSSGNPSRGGSPTFMGSAGSSPRSPSAPPHNARPQWGQRSTHQHESITSGQPEGPKSSFTGMFGRNAEALKAASGSLSNWLTNPNSNGSHQQQQYTPAEEPASPSMPPEIGPKRKPNRRGRSVPQARTVTPPPQFQQKSIEWRSASNSPRKPLSQYPRPYSASQAPTPDLVPRAPPRPIPQPQGPSLGPVRAVAPHLVPPTLSGSAVDPARTQILHQSSHTTPPLQIHAAMGTANPLQTSPPQGYRSRSVSPEPGSPSPDAAQCARSYLADIAALGANLEKSRSRPRRR